MTVVVGKVGPALRKVHPRLYLRPQRPSVLGFHIKNYTIGPKTEGLWGSEVSLKH